MRSLTGLTILAVLAGSVPAHAVSVTNRDDKEYKLTIEERTAKQEVTKQDVTLKPNGVLEGVCLQGCEIRLGDSDNDVYELEGTEVVSIEDGYLYYDGPEGSGPAPGSTAQPPPVGSPAPVPPPAAPQPSAAPVPTPPAR